MSSKGSILLQIIPDGLAAKDGRLRCGDIVRKVRLLALAENVLSCHTNVND